VIKIVANKLGGKMW